MLVPRVIEMLELGESLGRNTVQEAYAEYAKQKRHPLPAKSGRLSNEFSYLLQELQYLEMFGFKPSISIAQGLEIALEHNF